MCGNMDLQRISSDHGTGAFSWLFRKLAIPAYRCAPCRNRFFSIRTYRRIIARQHPLEHRSESQPVVPS
jgi:hypothetical protein